MTRKKPVVQQYFVLGQERRKSRCLRASVVALALTIIGAPLAAIMWIVAKPTLHYRVALHLSDCSVKTRDFTEQAFKRMARRHYLTGDVTA